MEPDTFRMGGVEYPAEKIDELERHVEGEAYVVRSDEEEVDDDQIVLYDCRRRKHE